MMLVLPLAQVRDWLIRVFGPGAENDVEERGLRFAEESLELVQSLGITREQALALVQQVYDKPEGDPKQELGGVMVTLVSLAAVTGLNPGAEFDKEWCRVHSDEVIAKIKSKHDGKLVVSARHRPDPLAHEPSIRVGFDVVGEFEENNRGPIYPGEYGDRSIKRSHRAEGRNFVG